MCASISNKNFNYKPAKSFITQNHLLILWKKKHREKICNTGNFISARMWPPCSTPTKFCSLSESNILAKKYTICFDTIYRQEVISKFVRHENAYEELHSTTEHFRKAKAFLGITLGEIILLFHPVHLELWNNACKCYLPKDKGLPYQSHRGTPEVLQQKSSRRCSSQCLGTCILRDGRPSTFGSKSLKGTVKYLPLRRLLYPS